MEMQATNKMIKSIVLTLLVLSVYSCGWRLRENAGLHPEIKKVNLIQLVEDYQLNKQLKKLLSANGAEVMETKAGADISLTVTDYKQEIISAAVDSQGRTVAREVILTIKYNLHGSQGEILLDQDIVRSSSLYRFDPDNVLGTERSQVKIINSLRSNVVKSLIMKIKHSLDRAREKG